MNIIKRKSNLFNTIFFYFFIAIISAFIFLLLTNTYYFNILQDKTEEQYSHKLENLSINLQTKYDELQSITEMITFSDSLKTVLTTKKSFKYKDYTVLSDSTILIQKFYRTMNFIHSVFILSEEDDIILSNSGTGRIDEYFRVLANYSVYSVDYWKNLTYKGQKTEILPPSYISNSVHNIKAKVIPIVQYATDDYVFTDPLVVNVRVSYIVNLLNETKLSDNSIIFLYNKGYVVCTSQSKSTLDLSDGELILLAERNIDKKTNTLKIDGKKYLVVTYKDSINNNNICAITPYSDLLLESFSVLALPVMIFTIGIVLVTILSFLFSRKIYKPIHNVALHLREQYLPHNEGLIRDDLAFLSQNIQSIVRELVQLKEDLSLAIPYVCERYLLSLFDNQEILNEEEVTSFLAQYDFSFPNKNFLVIYSILNFKEGFFNTHSKTEYTAICQGSLLIANDLFSNISDRFIFSIAANQICVILNLPSEYEKSEIASSIFNYHEALDIDDDMMIVHSGVGLLYEGVNGLKKSYNEALQASSQLTYLTTSMIRTYSQNSELTSSHYSIEEENQMINYLLQGDESKALSHFDSILRKNIDDHISSHSLKELYLQLYNTAIRVINRKRLNIYDIMGENYINISSHIDDLQSDELYNYLQTIYKETIAINMKTNEDTDLTNIRQYLDAHYTEELYLDSLADYFGKNANYLSKYIKKTLGVSFQDYTSALRINQAKLLLSNSNKSIVTIAKEVGFNSRHPFIRKFKILEGVTPTEYRKLHRSE